jgi:hypothetical protein
MVRNAAVTYEIDNDGNAVPEGEDADQQQSYDEFRADSSGADGGMKAWVYRCPENQSDGGLKQNASMEHLFTEAIDRFTLDEIMQLVRRDYMAPNELRWIIRIMIRDQNKLKLNKLYAVRKARQNPDEINPNKKSEIAEMMEANRRMMADFMRALAEQRVSTPPPPESFSPMQMMQFMMNSQNESMKTVAMLIAAMKPDATKSGTSDVMTMLEGMSRVQDFARNMNPSGENTGGSAVDIIKAASPFAPVLAAIIAKSGNAAPALAGPAPAALPNPVQPGAPVQPAPVIVAPPVTEPVREPPQEVDPAVNIAQLRDQLGKLADVAAQKPPAADVVSNLMPEIPEEMDSLIVDTLSGDDWFEKLSFIQPKIRAHREWFEEVRKEMLACYSDEKPTEK